LREMHRSGLAHYLTTGEAHVLGRRIELTAMRADGTECPVELAITRIPGDELPTFTGYIRDITTRRQAEEERAQLLAREQMARQEAEAANRLKDEFLATVSHELRTPLTAMLGWAKMLREGKLDAAATARGLEIVERSAKSQKQLIEDLLDVSRIIRGKLRLEARPVELVSIIEAASDAIHPAAEAKG